MPVTEYDSFLIFPLNQITEDFLLRLQRKNDSGAELFFVTSGYIVGECRCNAIRINRNDFHLSLTRQKTKISDWSSDVDGFYCRFSKTFYAGEDRENELELINSFLYQYPLRLSKAVFQRLSAHFDFIFKLSREREVDSALIQAYLSVCICEIAKLMRESSLDFYPSKSFAVAKKYHDLLDACIGKAQNIEFYAEQLKITPNHLNKSVKSVTGKTAIQMLNETRLSEAKSRLRYSDAPVNEIAYQLGFEDHSYFTRFFKKTTGIAPREYRKG